MIYTLHQEADFLSGFGQKNILPAAHFLTEVWYAVQSFTKKSCLRRIFFHKKILSMGHLVSVCCLVHQFIGIDNDSNSHTQ